MLKRAWSTIEFKAIDEDQRIIEGVASTPATDRYEDVVEPMGAQYKLPLPFLWQHQHGTPIGWVEDVKTTASGIRVRVRIAAAGVTAEIDKAWSLIKAGLVRGLSIGFTPLESAHINGTYGYHFTKWDWLELSAVTVPANAEATITSIKSFDTEHLRAASGESAAGSRAVRIKTLPGVPGNAKRKPTGDATMAKMTYREQIAAAEATVAASITRQEEIMKGATEAGRTLDDAEKQEFDNLDVEIKTVGDHIARLKRLADRAREEAQPVQPKTEDVPADATVQRAPSGIVSVRSNLEPGIGFARFAKAMYLAPGNPLQAEAYIKSNAAWRDQREGLVQLVKAAVAAGDTTTSGWASELVYAQNLMNEFIEYLRPMTIIGQIDTWRRVPFNVRMGSMTGGTTGYWVGQGKPIPVSKGTTSSTSLGITKAAGIAALDEELMRSSSPSAEVLIRGDLAKAVAYICDTSLIDPNQGGTANVQPASLTYGVTAVAATGTAYANLSADIQSLIGTMTDADVDVSQVVLVMSPRTALALSLMVTSLGQQQFPTMTASGGTLFGFRVVVSRHVAAITGSPDFGRMIVAINPEEIFLADEGEVMVEASREASLELLDNPTNASTGSTVATSMVSMFQTHSVALKAVRFINWTKRRSTACQYIRNALYA
jgi:HK97 family phage major capsid protein/HK97 family phage prohead protease